MSRRQLCSKVNLKRYARLQGAMSQSGSDRKSRVHRITVTGNGEQQLRYVEAEFPYRKFGLSSDYTGLMLATRITLPHFLISSAMSLPKSAGEPPIAVPPMLANRSFTLGSARTALVS